MGMKRRVLTLLVGVAFAAMGFAADITGKWLYKTTTKKGEQETTLTLKQDGDKLTGSMSARRGDQPISEGVVNGDTLSFVVETRQGKQTFKGQISGEEIRFKREINGKGGARELVAKKVN